MPANPKSPLARRRPPTQRRAEVLVQSVREAARQILEADGAEALTTNRVAERAGISVGSLYHYYPNKESIVADLFEDMLDRLVAEIVEEGRRTHLEDMPLEEALERFVRMMFDHRARLTGLHRDFLEQWGSRFEISNRVAPDGRTFGQITHDSLYSLLERNQDRIGVEDLDAAAYAISLIAEGFGRACWEERLPDTPVEEMTQRIARAMLAYLGVV
ncbi:MAG: TetR/AcrR family transcriptional regulator [Spirochaetaceae bacterium]|nr:TetR/AcrR family transcriptional regulator [Myxococcales bacterium]MCB9724784.1 TetR/AcrR family transcriptional regulator [Spirochaetaceae bacterium]